MCRKMCRKKCRKKCRENCGGTFVGEQRERTGKGGGIWGIRGKSLSLQYQ